MAQAARVVDVRGTSMVERAGVAPRILGAGEKLDARDTISVARDSWAILEFSDQTRITLRPNTVFRLDSYKADAPEAMLLGLVKGGMRVVTGFFGKRNPAGVRVQTVVATIGIRGTEFDARLCESDCSQEERLHPTPLRALAVARVVEIKGLAAAARGLDPARMLTSGAALYEGDGIATGPGAYAVLVFRDGSRITVTADSRLMIRVFQFDESSRTGHAVLNHVGGGAAVQTGAIAKQGPEFYRFISPLGEIRPRGTGFLSNVQSAAQSVGDGGQAAKDEADRRAAEEAAKLAGEAARRAAAAQAEAERQAAAAAAEAARLAAEAERLAAEAAAAVKLKIAQDPLVVLQAPKPGAGLGAPTPASAIDLAALAAAEAASAAAAAADKARAAAAAAAAEAEKLAAAAAAEAARLASLVAVQARRQQEEALLEKRKAEQAALAAKQGAEREAAEAKLKAEQDAAAAKLKMEQDAANAASHDFTQHAKTPAAPASIPLPFPVLPSKSEVQRLVADAKLKAEQDATAAKREGDPIAAAAREKTELLAEELRREAERQATDEVARQRAEGKAVLNFVPNLVNAHVANAKEAVTTGRQGPGEVGAAIGGQIGEAVGSSLGSGVGTFTGMAEGIKEGARQAGEGDIAGAIDALISAPDRGGSTGGERGAERGRSIGSSVGRDLGNAIDPREQQSEPATNGGTAAQPTWMMVWDGEIEVIGRGTVKSGEKLTLGDMQPMRAGPGDLLASAAPRPDQVKVDPGVFGGEPKPIDAGLYVWVRDGAVSLTKDDKSVDVPKGNAAVATRDDVKLLDAVPNFMRFDPTPLPVLSLTTKLDAFRLPDGALQNMCVIR